jgi:hypothetical protein
MHQRQRGIAMIEILGALMIAAMLVAGLTGMINTGIEDSKAQQTAQYQARMATAAATYLADNYGALALPAKLGQTLVITPAMLQAAGMTPPGMAAANPYGQTACLLVRPRVKSATAPTVIVLDALMVSEGGDPVPDRVLAYAAASAGAGFISARAPGVAQSAAGSWSLSATTAPSLASFIGSRCGAKAAGAGSLVSALFFDGPGQSADFLYRNRVPGMPELNQMNAPIGMGPAAVVVAEDACSGAGIAVDADRNLMNCTADNHWRQVASQTSWKDPVNSYADLPGAPDSKDGDVRLVASLGLAFSFQTGGGWRPLAVDQNGNFNVPGKLTVAGDASVGRDLKVGRDLAVTRDIVAQGDVTGVGFHGSYLDATDYIDAPSVQAYSQEKHLNDKCHEPHINPTTGKTEYWFAIGTMMMENTDGKSGSAIYPTMMVCSGTNETNARFVYMNGGTSRDYR